MKLRRPFLLLTKKAPGATKDFIDWILGPEGQKIVSKEFISVSEK